MNPIAIVVLVSLVAVLAVVGVVVIKRRSSVPIEHAVVQEERGLRERLTKPRASLAGALSGLFSSPNLGEDEWDELEDALVAADVGPVTASEIVGAVRVQNPRSGEQARVALQRELVRILSGKDRGLHLDHSPSVIVVVGVNGTGKTTSIAKIASSVAGGGSSVVLAAADTFRAAADTQLQLWGERVGVPVVSGSMGADPASVAFDALREAKDLGADVLIVDTAGRLHSQANLMGELGKVVRVLEKAAGGIDEVLLVLDGTTGQNGLQQARAFTKEIGVTGLVLTKLDGTSRGGIAVAVERTLGIPVKFIGVGEGMSDLLPFDPEAFVEALIAR